MVCFCDIPISRISDHTSVYGEYGIVLTREWGISKGLNPIFYISSSSNVRGSLLGMFKNPSEAEPQSKFYVMNTLAHLKPLKGGITIHGEYVVKSFYEECEWRYVPIIEEGRYAFLSPEEFENEEILESANEERRADGMLKFTVNDIRHLFVKNNDDVPPFVDFIESQLTSYTSNDRKLLFTRIITLEEILPDL